MDLHGALLPHPDRAAGTMQARQWTSSDSSASIIATASMSRDCQEMTLVDDLQLRPNDQLVNPRVALIAIFYEITQFVAIGPSCFNSLHSQGPAYPKGPIRRRIPFARSKRSGMSDMSVLLGSTAGQGCHMQERER